MSGSEVPRIEALSAVTLVTRDMVRAVRFYRSLGFDLHYGGEEAAFSSFRAGGGYLNLSAEPGGGAASHWGRVILHVSDVDVMYRRVESLGLQAEAPPLDAPWRERYFHLKDPDGHELSFAHPLD